MAWARPGPCGLPPARPVDNPNYSVVSARCSLQITGTMATMAAAAAVPKRAARSSGIPPSAPPSRYPTGGQRPFPAPWAPPYPPFAAPRKVPSSSPSQVSFLLPLDEATRFCSSSSTQFPTPTQTSGEAAEENTENAPPPPPSDPIKDAADALDIRVGHILKAWRHPEADSLYVEEVDVGEAEPRTICSGLVNYTPFDHLQDIKVVVLANLKPRNMRGIKSNGMLMVASDASHETVELLKPPEGSTPGERIWFGSEEEKDQQQDAATPNQVQKKKIWESVQPHLRTTDECVAVLGEHPMRTSAGVVACTTLKNANIS